MIGLVVRVAWVWDTPAAIGLLLAAILWARSRDDVAYVRIRGNGYRRLFFLVMLSNETLRILVQGLFLAAGLFAGNVPIRFDRVTLPLVLAPWLTTAQSVLALVAQDVATRRRFAEEAKKGEAP